MGMVLNNPMRLVRHVTDMNIQRTGPMENENGMSKLYFASAQKPMRDRKIPVAAANDPRKKYSSMVMTRSCLRLAPSVLRRTISWIR